MVLSDRFPPGTVIGNDFEIVRPLSQGGMGTVYVAIQRATGAPRALKLMRRALLGDAKFRQRFEQEARVGSRIRSDHVVQVVAAGVDERTQVPWLAMELLEGKGLAEYLEERRAIAPGEARLILGQICHALAAAHEVGVVHRDLKADNVFLAASRMVGMPFVVKLLDFGVAKILSEANRSTISIGTPMYMAPEQSQPTVQIGPAADVWALGLLTFRILTGHHFWLAGDDENAGPAAVWREVLVEPIPSATERARHYGAEALLPPGFDAWFGQCVARDIGARFANARVAEVDLASMLRATWTRSGLARAASRQRIS
jgi:serine/threonine protein kinase